VILGFYLLIIFMFLGFYLFFIKVVFLEVKKSLNEETIVGKTTRDEGKKQGAFAGIVF